MVLLTTPKLEDSLGGASQLCCLWLNTYNDSIWEHAQAELEHTTRLMACYSVLVKVELCRNVEVRRESMRFGYL